MKEDAQYVFHGSPVLLEGEAAVPKRNIRSRGEGDKEEIIFDDISFHATPYRWIALAYTYTSRQEYDLDGRKVYYNMGVSLYEYDPIIDVYGFESLEKSLEKLYGAGGYVYIFDKAHFFHTKGLGALEVITQMSVQPVRIEWVGDPMTELKKSGVTFRFIDLARPENADLRNYARIQ